MPLQGRFWALLMVSATPSASVQYKHISLSKEQGVQGLRSLFSVAESGRRGDRGRARHHALGQAHSATGPWSEVS